MGRTRSRSVIADTDDYVVVRGDYAPIVCDARPPEPPIDHQYPLTFHEGDDGEGERMPDYNHRRDERPAGSEAGHLEAGFAVTERNVGADKPHDVVMAHPIPIYRPIVRPEILYNYPPVAARFDEVCDRLNHQQVDECTDLLLDLLGWGVPLEYMVDLGFSLPGVIWLCAKLRLRLSWGIVLRAQEARIPFHSLSIMPEGYPDSKYSPSPPPSPSLSFDSESLD